MAVRPFYIEADIEGRQTHLSGGPRSSKGSQEVHIYQRDKGSITEPYRIIQRNIEKDGSLELRTEVYYQGDLIHSHVTDY